MINLPIRADDVAAIVAIDDPVLRNLWITQAYADFAGRLQRALGVDDHTWCGFAVWASATAGQSIRDEELPKFITRLLALDRHQRHLVEVNRELRPLRALRLVPVVGHVHVRQAFESALEDVSAHLAHGNTLVFAELAPLFVDFLESAEGRPGTPPTAPAAEADLRDAFDWWVQAAQQGDRGARAGAILAGNVLAVAHEQRRLQVDIAAAMDAGLLRADQLAEAMLPRWLPRLAAKVVGRVARRSIDRLVTALWDDVTTELLMTLRVPGATLRLRDDVPFGPDGREFPADLSELEPPVADPYRQWDRTSGTGRHSGAHDWALIADRMSYIVNLFRSRQQDARLAAEPFTSVQLDAMAAGRVPTGPLLPPAR
jgi:hypothetical protein